MLDVYDGEATMPNDTTPAARVAQQEAHRRMGPERRVELAAQMSEDAMRVTQAGIRARHPNLSPAVLRRRLMRVVLGGELYCQAKIDERG